MSDRKELVARRNLLGFLCFVNVPTRLKTSRAAIIGALGAEGLPTWVCREVADDRAFRMACREVADKGTVLDQLADAGGKLVKFQFTSKAVDETAATYARRATLALNLEDGTVTSADEPETAREAQQLIADMKERRSATQVRKMLEELFRNEMKTRGGGRTGIYPYPREKGSCFYVAAAHEEFISKVESAFRMFGGERAMDVVPLWDGDRGSDKLSKSAIVDGINSQVEALRYAVQNVWGEETRDDTVERQTARYREARLRVEAWADFLGEAAQGLLAKIGAADQEALAKAQQIRDERAATGDTSEHRAWLYDWDELLDGQARELTHREDYGCETSAFLSLARSKAKERGMKLLSQRCEGGCRMQAVAVE